MIYITLGRYKVTAGLGLSVNIIFMFHTFIFRQLYVLFVGISNSLTVHNVTK